MAKTLSIMLKLTDCMHNLRIAFKARGGVVFVAHKRKKEEEEMVAKLVIYSVQKGQSE